PLVHGLRTNQVVNVDQRAHEALEIVEGILARRVAERFRRIRVRFDEEAVDAGRDGRARERRQELPRAAPRVLAGYSVLADRVARVEDDGVTDLVQEIEAARIHDEIVVAKRVASLRDDDAIVAGVLDLLDGLRHVLGRQELAVLDVHDGSRLRGRDEELRLHAQVRRNLDDVANFGGRRSLIGIMNVREDRQIELKLHLLEQTKPGLEPRALVVLERATVVLRERRLEDQSNLESLRDCLEPLGRTHHQRLFFDDARAGDQKQPIRAAVDVADHDVLFFHGASKSLKYRAFWAQGRQLAIDSRSHAQ